MHFFNENVLISINISLKFIPKGPVNNIPALVQIMAWRRPGDKPLSEPMMIISLTHICVTRPQWVKPQLIQNKSDKPNGTTYDMGVRVSPGGLVTRGISENIRWTCRACSLNLHSMMTSSNGNIFSVTGHLCGEFSGLRWIPCTKASDAKLWCFIWSAPE